MSVLHNAIPKYLLAKINIVRFVSFTAVFALAFLNIYKPFGVETRFDLNKIQQIAYSSMVILTGVLVIVAARIVMYQVSRFYKVSYLVLIIVIVFEVVGMGSFYALFGKAILNDTRDFIEMLQLSVKNTVLVLIIPYSVSWLYFAWQEKKEELDMLAHAEHSPSGSENKMVSFYDEKGTLRLSLHINDLLYLEASDNYVSIHYKSNDKVVKYMIRNTLKKLESQLEKFDILRVHRSFLINSRMVRVLKKEKEGLFLELNANEEIRLPISKTYLQPVVDLLAEGGGD